MRHRLLYIVGTWGAGGLERQLCYLVQAMDRNRYKPVIVTWNPPGYDDVYLPWLRSLGVPLHPLSSTLSPVGKLVAFRGLVRKFKPEVVHSYSFYTNFAAKWSEFGLSTISIGSIRNDFLNESQRAGKVLGKLSARWPRIQICNSQAAQKSAKGRQELFKSSVSHYVVRNGMDTEQFRFDPTIPAKVKILAIGTLLPKKRWDRLLRVIALAAAQTLRFTVHHVGDGPLRQQLEVQAKELGLERVIEFLGVQCNISDQLARSTFLIHTADYEGCPNVIMEAMACGRAVLATDAGDVPWLVDDGETGFVVPRDDEAMLLERLILLINNRDLCTQMGRAGRVKAERDFGLDRLLSETFSVYRSSGWRD